MGLIFNATAETQHFVVFGNHFTLKSKQIKNYQDHISKFIEGERGDFGLVSLPETFEDPEFAKTEEAKKILAEKEKAGIDNRCRKLREIIYNNQVSLRMDLEKKNMKVDPSVLASEGEIKAMEELSRYQVAKDDEQEMRAKKFKEMTKKLKDQGQI